MARESSRSALRMESGTASATSDAVVPSSSVPATDTRAELSAYPSVTFNSRAAMPANATSVARTVPLVPESRRNPGSAALTSASSASTRLLLYAIPGAREDADLWGVGGAGEGEREARTVGAEDVQSEDLRDGREVAGVGHQLEVRRLGAGAARDGGLSRSGERAEDATHVEGVDRHAAVR